MNVTEQTPLSFLTVGQFMELLNTGKQNAPVAVQESEKRYIYGLRGIRQLFNVSHATAQRYKDTIIKDAVLQQGRKIIVDVDKAMELFNNWRA
mgnify:FL=1